MTTTTTIDLTHPVHVLCDDRTGGLGHRAQCGCGWAGSWHTDHADAEVDALDHREVAVGPPDEMDRLMSGLLDFQDDLAAVVVWLAENWSAHLPSLGWYANGDDRDGDRPALRMTGYCSPDRLADAAAVLGAMPTDDPANHTGNRYRRAVRDIGRVRIEVFTALHRCEGTETAP